MHAWGLGGLPSSCRGRRRCRGRRSLCESIPCTQRLRQSRARHWGRAELRGPGARRACCRCSETFARACEHSSRRPQGRARNRVNDCLPGFRREGVRAGLSGSPAGRWLCSGDDAAPLRRSRCRLCRGANAARQQMAGKRGTSGRFIACWPPRSATALAPVGASAPGSPVSGGLRFLPVRPSCAVLCAETAVWAPVGRPSPHQKP